MKLYSLALLATVAVAQTPVPKPSTCKPNGEGCVTISTPTSNYIVTTAPSRPDLEVKDALATVAVAQTPAPIISYCSQTPNDHCEPAPKPAPLFNTDVLDAPVTFSSSGLLAMNFANTTKEGCSQYFGHWDAKRKLCKGTIQFDGMGQVSCSRGRKRNESWVVTCWYKPNVPQSAKEGK